MLIFFEGVAQKEQIKFQNEELKTPFPQTEQYNLGFRFLFFFFGVGRREHREATQLGSNLLAIIEI